MPYEQKAMKWSDNKEAVCIDMSVRMFDLRNYWKDLESVTCWEEGEGLKLKITALNSD
jgi:hypothetical protein